MESKVKTLDVIRRRLAAPRAPRDPRTRLLGNIDGPISPALREILDRPGRPASVLLALLERPSGTTVLFTERATHLKDHAGQVSLPGGRIAAGETPAEAALREAHEEVGLEPEAVDVIGSLDEFLTGHRLHRACPSSASSATPRSSRRRIRARSRACSRCRSASSSIAAR